MTPPGPRVVVAAWVGSTNLGDELIHRALLARLHAHGAVPTSVSVAPADTARVHGVTAIPSGRLRPLWRELARSGRLVLGGGGLLQDESSLLNVPYHLSRPVLAALAGARILGVGLGVGRLRPPTRTLVRRVLRRVPVGARDTRSAARLRDLGLREVRLTGDLAVSLPSVTVPVRDELVVSLRPRPVGGWRPARRAWTRGLPDEPRLAAAAAALEGLAGAHGLALRFVALQADRDGPLHDRLADRISRVDVACVRPVLSDLLAEVGRGRAVVGMRYHALVAALLTGRPALGLAYAAKVTSLADDAPGAVRVLPRPLDRAVPADLASVLAVPGVTVAADLARLRDRERGNEALLDRLFADAAPPG